MDRDKAVEAAADIVQAHAFDRGMQAAGTGNHGVSPFCQGVPCRIVAANNLARNFVARGKIGMFIPDYLHYQE
jgi:hypothetical protein